MNVNYLNSKHKVVSKYFTGKTVMDESLTDFQEKKSFKVLNNNKASSVKPKVKKVKKVKGQKDIRTALKPKKHELVAYTEDFDSVCKKSGIDVDSEQLQLAIALSKSLHTESEPDIPTSSKSLTAQQRNGLIRTTLKEYGFKVPEKPSISKKPKKRRKPYKLLLTSDEEKQQIITDRYTQRLFELNNLTTSLEQDFVKTSLLIYNMSTNVEYEDIKDDSVFYVESLIEESPNSMGCLLKQWSDIPGRPLSPQPNKSELIFSEVECSQDEVDIVLSGRLKYSKHILNKKNLSKDRGKRINCSIDEKHIDRTDTKPETHSIVSDTYSDKNISPEDPEVLTICSDSDDSMNSSKYRTSSTVDKEEKQLLVVTQPSRSLSPDLFDEEDTVVELPIAIMMESTVKPGHNVTKETSEVMDFTQCVNVLSQKNSNSFPNRQPLSQFSQLVDVTKRKSNDYMEMTECVGGTSQPAWGKHEWKDVTEQCKNNISPGKTTEENGTSAENVEIVELADIGGPSPHEVKKIVDLTGYCENEDKIDKNGTGDNNINNALTTSQHIDLTGTCRNNIENENNNASMDSIEHMDLTQSSNSSTDTLPFVHISGKPTVSNKSLEDTIIMNEDDYLETKSPEVNKDVKDSGSKILSQHVESEGIVAIISPKIKSIENEETSIISLNETCEIPAVDHGIDLTQSSDSNDVCNNVNNNSTLEINNSSLGKKDNVSVDYDEALENMNLHPYYTHEENDDNSIELDKQSPSNDNTIISNDKHQPLEMTKNKLKSPTKTDSVQNHFDFGGISIIENLPSFNRESRNTINNMTNDSMSDSLPMVNVKGNTSPRKYKSPIEEVPDPVVNSVNYRNINDKSGNSRPQTPQNKVNRNVSVETPEQSEYIVKTDNVTPMLDFASMSTPERNRELDKYGLKPFKRKRAIQLLTHLYNQTHPYVESTEEITSPSKKRKKYDPIRPSSSKSSSTSVSPRNKSKSPRKQSRSPRMCAGDSEDFNELDKENVLFEVTTEVPAIRNVECDADDWVFQKREKAKLHSCRVPLHIALHNYVSCRRRLQEAILRYEPVNIDVIHKELAASGHRYDRKDLLKFMDKKCITVKTVDNVKSNQRY